MLIDNIKELNKFVNSIGDIPPDLIIDKLAESEILVSPEIAKLLLLSPDKHITQITR